jgi:hypothetical protein
MRKIAVMFGLLLLAASIIVPVVAPLTIVQVTLVSREIL